MGLDLFDCGHPIPNTGSWDAGSRALEIAKNLGEGDTALCLLSGGASAMLAHPKQGISRKTKEWLTRALLQAGAPIDTVNACRSAVSGIKGGKLMEACHPARVVTLAISDVPTADPRWVGSAPSTLPPQAQGLGTLLGRHLPATPLPKDLQCIVDADAEERPALAPDHIFEVIADNGTAIEAARKRAEELGLKVELEPGVASGEASDTGAQFAAMGRQRMRQTGVDVIIWGGETTVTIRGDGAGGRAHEFVVGALAELGDHFVCAYGTDGVDGNSGGAGAQGDRSLLSAAASLGLDLAGSLAHSDTGSALAALSAQLPKCATGTNVADIYLLIR
jgi:hydroxypyruvate reductase